jgi:uncharacterized protein YceH (UPF0502 family)
MDLDPTEIRVLGCLMEKQRTTPDAYPLSLNALRLACNQATNRDPVVEYDDATIRAALHQLGRRRWTRLASAGTRTAKYRHLLDDALPLDRGEQAVMCVLMLRGPQTPGELKQRSERMHVFGDLAALRVTLDRLIDRGLVRRLDRRPGHKEERYLQLLGDLDADEPRPPPATNAAAASPARPWADRQPAGSLDDVARAHDLSDRSRDLPPAVDPGVDRAVDPGVHPAVDPAVVAELTDRVARLEREVAELREALGG